jgi:hypothetical protein
MTRLLLGHYVKLNKFVSMNNCSETTKLYHELNNCKNDLTE